MDGKEVSEFFQIYRKRGFEQSINILFNAENNEYLEKDFYNELKAREMHLNDFYRSKDNLLKYSLIAYKLNEDYDKIIYLTEKGNDLKKLVDQINDLLKKKRKKSKK
ncbi:MAG: hypothetical protein GF364_06415 [Candidatus Lokiarchaeota archaeon]|nr:hypothetical protein [Candidatus Lokiarchaeota archaeon]